jgi:hypothetical protein
LTTITATAPAFWAFFTFWTNVQVPRSEERDRAGGEADQRLAAVGGHVDAVVHQHDVAADARLRRLQPEGGARRPVGDAGDLDEDPPRIARGLQAQVRGGGRIG